jgi:hypothetical protein
MEYIEKLKNISPQAAERFIMTAIRFYAETIANGEPNTYFTKLSNLDYPNIDKDREEEHKLAMEFLNWNDNQVALNSTSMAGYESEDDQTPDQVDTMAKEGWEESMKSIFGADFYDDDLKNETTPD